MQYLPILYRDETDLLDIYYTRPAPVCGHVTSFGSGALITSQGWNILNLGSLIPVFVTAASLLWLAKQHRQKQTA